MSTSRTVVALVALGLSGCAEASSPAPAPAPAPTVSTAVPAPAATPAKPARDPWSDPTALAAGIAQTHYVPVITAGKPYTVTDSASGDVLQIRGSDILEHPDGRAQAYRTGPLEGHALASTTTADGEELVLDFAVVWDPSAPTMGGEPGAFRVTGVDVHQRGSGAPRHTFTASGDHWVRTPAG